MFSLMLHTTIFLFTLITGAVNSGPNTYWSKRSGEIRQTGIQEQEVSTEIGDKTNLHQEENKRQNNNYRGFPLLPFSTIVGNKVFSRDKITVKNQNLRRYLDYKLFLRYL
jgi:hypothetical protein